MIDWAAALPMLGTGLAMLAVMMGMLWVAHFPLRNAAIVDVGWGLGLALLAVTYACRGPGLAERKWLMAATVVAYGVRLAAYLFFTRILGHPEEGRYVQLRKEWGRNARWRMLLFYETQAVAAVALSLPFLIAAMNPAPAMAALEWAALALWIAAKAGEAVADAQLNRFKADPANRGKVCREGLWRYSRHPNYFFEWMMWVAWALYAGASPGGWMAWLSPALMLYFLLRVTGIPATEAQALRSKGEAYRDYQRTVSAFVPWMPRRA
jgi:steroid 5-alpha reductase family enzyme